MEHSGSRFLLDDFYTFLSYPGLGRMMNLLCGVGPAPDVVVRI